MSRDDWIPIKINPGTERAKGKVDPGTRPLRESSHWPIVTRVDEVNASRIQTRSLNHGRIQQPPTHPAPTRCSLDHDQKLHYTRAPLPIELQYPAKPLFGEDSKQELSVFERGNREQLELRIRERGTKPATAGLGIESEQKCPQRRKLPDVELSDVEIRALWIGPQRHVPLSSQASAKRRHWRSCVRMQRFKCRYSVNLAQCEKIPEGYSKSFSFTAGINGDIVESLSAVESRDELAVRATPLTWRADCACKLCSRSPRAFGCDNRLALPQLQPNGPFG